MDTNDMQAPSSLFGSGEVEDTIDVPMTEDEPDDIVVMTDADQLSHEQIHIEDPDFLDADRAQGLVSDSVEGGFAFTVVENSTARLTKAYTLAPVIGERPVELASPRTGLGRFIRVRCHTAAQLARLLGGLNQRQALLAAPLPGVRRQRRMIYLRQYEALSAELRRRDGAGPLYRGSVFTYVVGEAGLLTVDFDIKDMSGETRLLLDTLYGGSVRRLFEQIDPGWRDALWVERPSSSSGVTDTREGGATRAGGLHIFTVAKDGADIPRYIAALRARALLEGFGFPVVDAAGRVHVKTVIDLTASGSPHWLTFEADAVLSGDGLRYATGARDARWGEGGLLDTRALPDLTETERSEVARIEARLRASMEAEAHTRKLAHGAERKAALVRSGVSEAEAERQVLAAAEAGRLDPQASYLFDTDVLGTGRRDYTGEQILRNLDRFHLATSADPLEPDYHGGRNLARWYASARYRGARCDSFAHGGQRFRLAYDAADAVLAWAERAPGETLADRLERLIGVARHYLPADPPAAAVLLEQEGLPDPGLVLFGWQREDSPVPVELPDLLLAGAWRRLALCALVWRGVFTAAWEELVSTPDFVLPIGVDWAEAKRRLDAAILQVKAESDAERPLPRPVFVMLSRDTEVLAVAGEQALVAAKAEVYVRGAALVQPGWEHGLDHNGNLTTTPRLVVMDSQANAGVRAALSRVADWYLPVSPTRKQPVQAHPNELIAATLLSRVGRWQLAPCLGVILAPTLRHDLSIVHEPGLDLASGLYLDRDSAARIRLWDCLERPTKADALRGLDLLKDLLRETAFVGGTDRAVGLSGMITPVVRAALSGAPLHLFDGPDSGQGKSYVVDLASFILTGHACAVLSEQKGNPAELEKTLDVQLIGGDQLISFDNMKKLSGARIYTVLSQPTVTVRYLGLGRTAKITPQVTFFATGINVKYPAELIRRMVKGVIDTGLEFAFLRQYTQNPVQMILADRGAYISAAIAIVRWFARDGRSADRLPPPGNYGDWSDRVRSALVALGEADPAASMMEAAKADPSRLLRGRFLTACAEAFPLGNGGASEEFTAKDLVVKAQEKVASPGRASSVEGADETAPVVQVFSSAAFTPRFADLLAVLVEVAGERNGEINTRRLGVWLGRNHRRPVDGLRFVKFGLNTHTELAIWRLESV